MVCDAAIYHPTLSKFLKFIDTTPKREKIFRLVVYLSRFLSYYTFRKGFSKEVVDVFSSLKQNFTFMRKGMRFLKPLNHLQITAKTYDNKLMDPVLQHTTIIRNLGYAGYLGLDSVTWFKMMNLVSSKRMTTVPTWCSRFWLIALIAGVINSIRTIQINSAKAKESEKESPEVGQKIYAAKRKIVWDFLDMFIALNSLKYLNFSEGDVGFAGTITSIMGLRDMWSST